MSAGRHRRRTVQVAVVSLFALVALAPALSSGAPATLRYATGEFVVNCTGSGQLCDPPFRQTVKVPSGGRVTAVRYTPSQGHCSPIRIHVLLNGTQIGITGFVEPSETSELALLSDPIRKGRAVLGYRAEGRTGGCNVGQLGSWGGRVVTTVTLPETRIGSHPKGKTHRRTARFTFSGNGSGSKFECRLDRGKFRRCASPKAYASLAVGRHVFRVRFIDRAGNRDATPAIFRWRILP